MDVAVVGAGVCGLTTALTCAENGHRVTVYAASVSPDTTSDVAGGLFLPHLIPATPAVIGFLQESARAYEALISKQVGVVRQTHYNLSSDRSSGRDAIVPFAEVFPDLEEVGGPGLPGGYAHGWRFSTYAVDTRVFMPYLAEKLVAAGAKVSRRQVTRQDLYNMPHDVTINCSGLGARSLADDPTVFPVKGQVVYVPPADLDYSVVHDTYYAMPRTDRCILGGTYEPNVEDLAPSDEVTARIIEGNRRLLPNLKESDVIGVRTGLRPARRDGPRIEAEETEDRLIIHNYGHAGSGWTLAWGCARQVLRLISRS